MLTFFYFSLPAQNKKVPDDFCISESENNLLNRINLFRVENGKNEISNSLSLSYVASLHADDLLNNHPDTSICLLSSWSDKGNWKACCYNKYTECQDCMWDKPKELTQFTYRGYELAMYFENDFNVDSIMAMILSSDDARDMILTNGNYKKKKWICGGVGINKNYVSIWFAQRADKYGNAKVCKDEIVVVNDNQNKPSSFYVIISSSDNLKDAKESLKRLKQSGYTEAGILKSNQNQRVYLKVFSTLKEAMFFKQNLPYTYNDAWIFKK